MKLRWLVLFLLSPLCIQSPAQEALRYSIAGEKAAEARKLALQHQTYNLALGPVQFLLGASLGTSYVDNVDLVEEGGQADFILEPRLTIRGFWPVTMKNALNLSVGIGYSKYLNNSQYDRFSITPDSQLSFELFIKNVRVSFHEAFSYSEDPLQSGSISGVAQYGGFENRIGFQADWDLHDLILSAGYDHYNFISGTADFDYLTRSAELFFVRGIFLIDPTFSVGPEATAGLTDYHQNLLNDNTSFSGGLLAEWRLSPKLQLRGRFGYVSYSFDRSETTVSPITPAEDASTYYFNLGFNHVLNESISHSLDAGRETQLGIYSDFVELWFLRYQASFKLFKGIGSGINFFAEQGKDASSVFGEEYTRFGVGARFSYQLMEKLSTGLSYQFTTKDSDVAGRDYSQNRISLDFNYRF